MTREEFITNYAPYATAAAAGTKVFPQVVILMAAHESADGNSQLAKPPYFNFFGIKATNWPGKKVSFNTREYEGGKEVIKVQDFRDYGSAKESFSDFIKLISQQTRYKAALSAPSWQEQIVRIAAAGYATDPNYSSKLITTGNKFSALLTKMFSNPTARNLIEAAVYISFLMAANHKNNETTIY